MVDVYIILEFKKWWIAAAMFDRKIVYTEIIQKLNFKSTAYSRCRIQNGG